MSYLLGIVNYSVDFDSGLTENSIYGNSSIDCVVTVLDKHNNRINLNRQCSGVMDIPGVHLWWPYTHEPKGEKPGYLYTLEVVLTNDAYQGEQDVYRLKFGIRTIQYTNEDFKINGKPFYFRGFGRHEDYSVNLLFFVS